MDLARYVVDAVVLEGRSHREVARAHGVSKSWVGKLVERFREGGYEAIAPRSRAAKTIPHRTPPELGDEVVKLRKQLTEEGDAGAETIRYHLVLRRSDVASVTTIWRVLRLRGFVTPQPHKRPRSSWVRFEAKLPNERWQSDVTGSSGRCSTATRGGIDRLSKWGVAPADAFVQVKATYSVAGPLPNRN